MVVVVVVVVGWGKREDIRTGEDVIRYDVL